MRGRGAANNPPNRFDRLRYVRTAADLPPQYGERGEPVDPSLEVDPGTVLIRDASRTILSTNDSPDVGFDTSLNPYRGCMHGCAYCYARPNHEYLGFSAGLDFETHILVKERAPELLRKRLGLPSWKPQVIAFSGVTDAYQPVERKLEITRRCLRVLAEFRNPVAIITKNWLITRDIDLLGELASHHAASVVLSITTLDAKLQTRMEPKASRPSKRLAAIEQLAAAGIPVGVNVAPVIPGLTDHEIPAIVRAASDAGASFAGMIMLRLPHGVKHLFADWLEQHLPDRREKVLNRVRAMRGGQLYDANFAFRGRGKGLFAEQTEELFRLACRRSGLDTQGPMLSAKRFRCTGASRQMDLFGDSVDQEEEIPPS
jgi:DNA repair photolyase